MAKIDIQNVNVSYFIRKSAAVHKDLSRDAVGAPIVIGRRYFEIAALRDFSLHLGNRDRVGVVGSNGSGKSTLLKLCAGALSAQSGLIEIEGRTSAQFSLGAGLKPQLSGRQNAELKCLYLGVAQREVSEQVESVKQLSGLGGYFELPMSSYSAGMKSRLVMSLLRIVQGEILIMDEWINAADPRLNDTVEGIQKRLIDQSKILLLASHSERVLKSWVDKLIWLDQGQLKATGDVEEVYKEYHSWMKTQS